MNDEMIKEYTAFAQKEWPSDLGLWKVMFQGFLGFVQMNLAGGVPDSPFNELILDVFTRIARARMENKPIILYSFNCGPELFYAMDLEPVMLEVLGVGMAPFNMNHPYIDQTNQMGYGDNPTICNAQRPLLAIYNRGELPKADLLVYLSTPCNSLATNYQVYEHMTGIPTFTIDTPYWSYDPASEFYDEKTVGYVVKQYKGLISWLEEKTGHKFNVDKFQETMIRVNQARENVMEFNDLLKAVPCPVHSWEAFTNWSIMGHTAGTQRAVEMTGWMRDHAAEEVRNGRGALPDEKIRVIWPYTHVFFDQNLFRWLEKTFSAVAIMDLLGHYHISSHDVSTVDKCFESLAMGALDYSMVDTCRGPAEFYIDYLLRFIKDYRIDCAVIPMQYACKQYYAMMGLAAEAMRREAGIPVLLFGCDPYDSREVPPKEVRGRIEEFIKEIVM
jgi:benzoyl-CoA reductase subunit B